MKDLDISFVKRTQKIINEYSGNLEYTLLINCTLGLIQLPFEINKEKRLSFLNRNLNDVDIIQEIFKKDSNYTFSPTKFNQQKEGYVRARKNLYTFLQHLRNSLAHLALAETQNEDGEWASIRLRDINVRNNDNVELEVTIDKDDLKTLAMYLSDEYINEIQELNSK
jgi:HEPN family protein